MDSMEKETKRMPLNSRLTEQQKEEADNLMKEVEEFAREHKKQYEDEVAVLQSIVDSKSFSVIPMSVHNLAVICPERTHLYLQPIHDLYSTLDLRNPSFEKIKKGVKLTLRALDTLIRQERMAYKNQANTLITQRRKEGKPWNLKEESQYFEHVVYDPSQMLVEFNNLLLQGILLDEEQQKLLGVIYDLVHKQAAEMLETRKRAVANCDILSK